MPRDQRSSVREGARDAVLAVLWTRSPRDHRQPPPAFRRRQVVVLLVVLAGAAVLGWSLRIEPGSDQFYPATLLLAGVWVTGAFLSGPLHLGRADGSRPVVVPILLGLAFGGVFLVGALVLRQVPPLADEARAVLEYAEQGSGPLLLLVTLVNGVAEELFFRGAAYAAIPRWQVPVTTVLYAVATAATGNVMLGFAAVLLGVVVGLERRATGGILAPILTHCTWSLLMLFALPVVLG